MRALKDPLSETARQEMLRLMGGMDQKELAERAGVDYRQLHRFHKGEGNPYPTLMDTILRFLGSSLCDALAGVKPSPKPPEKALDVETRVVVRCLTQIRDVSKRADLVAIAQILAGQSRRRKRGSGGR